MSENGVIEYKGLSFDDPITSVLDSTPLIGHKIYFNSMTVGGQWNIIPYQRGDV